MPAIDLKDGRCVRLFQGDYDQVTVFPEEPSDAAARWVSGGARMLHLVDLDGAKAGHIVNLDAIRRITAAVSIPVELGGGIRTLDDVDRVLDMGASRVIIGTAAVDDRQFVSSALARHGDRVAIGIDARDGLVATRGWTVTSSVRSLDLAREMVGLGARRIIYTDIRRDGTLTEPDYDVTAELVRESGASIVASGGVSRIGHLLRLMRIGCESAIIGRALYTGDLDLASALAALDETGRVSLVNPKPGSRAPSIAAWKYHAVREELLSLIPADDRGAESMTLPGLVEEALHSSIRDDLGSIGWYVTAVRLDLEARGIVERVIGATPSRVRRRV